MTEKNRLGLERHKFLPRQSKFEPAAKCFFSQNHSRKLIYHVHLLIIRKDQKGELYVGMAKNLKVRISEHKNELRDGFTEKKYFQIYRGVL
jgi:hypothetical protein